MKKTIVQILPALEYGGVERGTLEVAAELVRKKHRSIVISDYGRLVPQLIKEGSEHINLEKNLFFVLNLYLSYKVFLKKKKLTLCMHVHDYLPGYLF